MDIRPAPLPRRILLFGVPLILGTLELGHPGLWPGDDIVATVAPMAAWWTALHVLQVPLFALLGVAAFLLVRGLPGRAALIGRRAIGLFIVVYPAFDAAVGISSGILLQTLPTLGPGQRAALEPALQALFWGPVTGLMAIVGSASWLVALLASAWARRRAGAPRVACGLLAVSGVLLAISHVRPFGPLACFCFLGAAALIEFRPVE